MIPVGYRWGNYRPRSYLCVWWHLDLNEPGLHEACVTAFLTLVSNMMELCRHLRKESPQKEAWKHRVSPPLPPWLGAFLSHGFFIHPVGRRRRGLSEALLAVLLRPRKHRMLFHTKSHQIPHTQNQVAHMAEPPINSFVGPGCGRATPRANKPKPSHSQRPPACSPNLCSEWLAVMEICN